MLRKIRITLAAVFFVVLTALFLDFTGTLHAWLGWMAKIQFLPAVLALNAAVIVGLVLLTFVCGRVYCSVICPLGVFQDVVSWLSGRRRIYHKGRMKDGRKVVKRRFSYSKAKNWLRYIVLAVFILALILGVSSFVALLEPYSAFGRMVSNLLGPLWIWGNNALATISERAGGYGFYHKDVWIKSLPVFIVAVVTFVAIVVLAWRGGRTYCNTICPVGSVLGLLSKFSLFQPTIDVTKCNNCGQCSARCKASCIDGVAHKIDYTRCVACMDCLEACRHGALKYRWRYNKTSCAACESNSRRSFLIGTGLLIGGAITARAQEKASEIGRVTEKINGGAGRDGHVGDGQANLFPKTKPSRTTPIVPPGAQGIKHLADHCTACQLCITVCPNDVLRPSGGLMTLMQPESSYENGYCRPECVKCSEVCPSGAILKLTTAEKSSTQIGHAVWVRENCLPANGGPRCGHCAHHCPTGAITMVETGLGGERPVKIPVVNREMCIGCGACEYLCPARPSAAIYVEGHEVHRII
ncbi:MAG: 4Fe-4S binding protein [Bacteroidales bacterium]|nr:4Fe-4S binding protein [Bacteroidales bacterium]